MDKLSLSIMPSFRCNYNCDYCYLSDSDRQSKARLDLRVLDYKLNELQSRFDINSVSIYGGEVGLFETEYLDEIYSVMKNHSLDFTFSTNLSSNNLIKFCRVKNIPLLVSLNEERPHYTETIKKLEQLEDLNITIGVVVLPSILKKDPNLLMVELSKFKRPVYFFQYYQSHNITKYKFNQIEFNEFMIKIANIYRDYDIDIVNITEWLDPNYKSSSKNFIYIMPDGSYSTTSYNEYNESFVTFNTLDEWDVYTDKIEYERSMTTYCGICDLYDKCIAEHVVDTRFPNCSGNPKIIRILKK